jgi:hypothetical protein
MQGLHHTCIHVYTCQCPIASTGAQFPFRPITSSSQLLSSAPPSRAPHARAGAAHGRRSAADPIRYLDSCMLLCGIHRRWDPAVSRRAAPPVSFHCPVVTSVDFFHLSTPIRPTKLRSPSCGPTPHSLHHAWNDAATAALPFTCMPLHGCHPVGPTRQP